MPQPLNDAVVVITGASSGIGRAAAYKFAARGSSSVPFWVKFNMDPSYEALERCLTAVEPFDEIWMTLFQHGVECVGLVPIEKWRELIETHAERKSGFLGLDERPYPRYFGALASYQEAIQQLPARYPLAGPLILNQLAVFVGEREDQCPVKWDDLGAAVRSGPVRSRSALQNA